MKSFFGIVFILQTCNLILVDPLVIVVLELVYRDVDMFWGFLETDGVQDSRSRMSHNFAQYFRRQVLSNKYICQNSGSNLPFDEFSTFAELLDIHAVNWMENCS